MGIGSKFLKRPRWRRSKIPKDQLQRLPVELIEEILLAAWCPPCSFPLRRSYISFFLVNHLWAALMKRIMLKHVRLDSVWAVIWYDALYHQYQTRIMKYIPVDNHNHNMSITENPPNPRDLCKDLVMISAWNPYANIMHEVAALDLTRITSSCSQLERAQLNFGTTFIQPATIASAFVQLNKLTDLHITATAVRPAHAQAIPWVDMSSQLPQIRDLTLNVADAPFTVDFINYCPALRSLTLESNVENLEKLSSYIPHRLGKASSKGNTGGRHVIVRPIFDHEDADLRERADLCTPILMALVPLLP